MHPSVTRLLKFAKKATEGKAQPIETFADLIRVLEITSATMTNWKARGVSKEGAEHAEKVFGCTVAYIRSGIEGGATAPVATRVETTWPFRMASFADYERLTDTGKGIVEKAVKDAVVEAQRAGFTKGKAA